MATDYHRATSESIPDEGENRPLIQHEPPQGHYSPASGEWDGQLANPDLVQAAEPQYPGYPGPVQRRTWATQIGIAFNLSLAERAILQSYAHDAGTPQGCWKAADTMAYELGCHEKSIRDTREKLINLGILRDEGRQKRARRVTLNFDVTGSQTRLQVQDPATPELASGYDVQTGSETRLQVQDPATPELASGYDVQTGPETRLQAQDPATPELASGEPGEKRESRTKISLLSGSNSSSPGPAPAFGTREMTTAERIEYIVKENWDLLQDAGWNRLGGALNHYQKFGLEYLRRDLERKKAAVERASLAARTCAHCHTVHDISEQVEPCPRCEAPICVSRLNSCHQKNCHRNSGRYRNRG